MNNLCILWSMPVPRSPLLLALVALLAATEGIAQSKPLIDKDILLKAIQAYAPTPQTMVAGVSTARWTSSKLPKRPREDW